METIKFKQCATCFIVLLLWSYLNSTLSWLIAITGQLLVQWTIAWYLARFWRTTLRPLILPLIRDIEQAAGRQRPLTKASSETSISSTTTITSTTSTTTAIIDTNGSSNGKHRPSITEDHVPHTNGHHRPSLQMTSSYHQSVEDELYVRSTRRAVFITGCDAGIGHDLAIQLAEKGFTVFASVLDWYGRGAQNLEEHSKSKGLKIHVLKVSILSHPAPPGGSPSRPLLTSVPLLVFIA